MTRARTDRTAERILRQIRGEVIGRNERSLDEITRIYRAVSRQVREDIRGVTDPREIERIAIARMDEALGGVLSVIEPGISTAAIEGAGTITRQFAEIFPGRSLPRIATELEAQRAAAEVLRGRIVVDRVPISARLREHHADVARRLGSEVQQALRAGESIFETSERILAADTRPTQVAQYVRDLEAAARRGGEDLQREIRRYRRQIDRLGSADRGATSIRAATESLLQRLEGATTDAQIDRAVNRWVLDKAQYHAKVTARTETIRAYRESYIASTRGQSFTKGYRWSLSSGHKVADVCDLLAGQDLYGLGPGGYPVDQVPDIPHPSDLCTLTAIIDEHHFDRRIAEIEGTPEPPRTWESGNRETSEAWLRRQAPELRREILGPTRDRILSEGGTRVTSGQGTIRRVRDITAEHDARRHDAH